MPKLLIPEHLDFRFVFPALIAAISLAWLGTAPAQTPCPSATVCPDDGSGPYGSLLNNDEFNASVQALPPAAFLTHRVQPPLPPHAYLSNLPAVSEQGTTAHLGSPGSCEAQSFGYGLGSYTAARLPNGSHKWPAALPQNSVSPAYLFAWGMFTGAAQCPRGGPALLYLNHLVGFGAPTRARVPYQPDCSYFTAVQQQRNFPDNYPDMKRFRIGSYAVFNIHDNSQAVQRIKEYIANGQAVAFSGWVLCGYGTDLPMQDSVIYETDYVIDQQTGNPAGHGQLVVGYDDNVGTPGNQGGLLIQNSFGTAWPASAGATSIAPPGMAYWSYCSFDQTQKLAAVAYPRDPGPPAGVRLSRSRGAPLASITGAFQWAPDGPSPTAYLILTHFFRDPVALSHISLTEPGGQAITATGRYGQNISTGYTYLKRTDGNTFLSGTWGVSLEGADMRGNPVIYTGSIQVGQAEPNSLPEASMAGQTITDSTGAVAVLTP
jgi:hypothetical protein